MLLAVLCLTHLSAGLETKLCKHEKTVDAIRNIYGCLKDFQKDFVGFWLIGDRTEGKKKFKHRSGVPNMGGDGGGPYT